MVSLVPVHQGNNISVLAEEKYSQPYFCTSLISQLCNKDTIGSFGLVKFAKGQGTQYVILI